MIVTSKAAWCLHGNPVAISDTFKDRVIQAIGSRAEGIEVGQILNFSYGRGAYRVLKIEGSSITIEPVEKKDGIAQG